MATSRRNQTSTRASNRRTTTKATEAPESSASAMVEPPTPEVNEQEVNKQSANEQTDPISEAAPESATPEVSTESTPEESPMSNAEVIEATATPAEGNGSAIEILSDLPSLSAGNRPVMSDDFEMAGTIQSSGIRPIEASHLAIYGTILNGRPIMSSSLKVAEMLPGNRPIFYSDFHSVEGSETFGRPVMASEPGLLSADRHMGDRPVFSNEIDDASSLMGFID